MSKIAMKLAALVCAGLLALTGCSWNSPQTAAQVGDLRIAESEITPIATALAEVSTETTDTAASFNSTVLTLMIQSELAHSAIVSAGITIADTDRKTLYATNEQLATLAADPVTAEFMQRYADLYLMSQTDDGKTAFAKVAQETKVVVNPRYGTWDSSQLALTDAGGSLSETAPAKS